MTIHGTGFSTRSGAGNNDKTTVAGKRILLAMCHPHAGARYLFGIHHLATWRFRVHLNPRLNADWQQAASSGPWLRARGTRLGPKEPSSSDTVESRLP